MKSEEEMESTAAEAMVSAASGGDAPAPQATSDSSMVVGEQYNQMVQNIVDMGYEKSQVRRIQ